MHAIHLNVPRVALLASVVALLATVGVLAAAARVGDVSLGAFGGGKRAVSATGSVSSGAPRSVFLGSPFVTRFRVSVPWTAPMR